MRRQVVQLQGGFKPAPIPPGYQALPEGLPVIETLESSKGPWSRNGAYGQQVTYSYPARLDADPILVFGIDRQPGPPRPRTLHLFRSDVDLGASGNAEVYAKITYGVGGVQNTFFCDYSRGGQISLVCDAVRVEVVPYAVREEAAYTPPSGIQILGALLSHQGSAPPRPPTFTTQRVPVTDTTGRSFPVPDFARWVYVNQVQALHVTDLMNFISQNAINLRQLTISKDMILLGSPVPGGTTLINISNQTALSTENYSLTFELGL